MMIFGKKLIIVGMVILLLFAALSLSCNKESALGPKLSIDTPAINAMTNKQCVKPAAYMRANHMTMLNSWRDTVVRGGDRNLGEIDGVMYEKSLQHTCLKCHSNPSEFCDKCHSYASVKVYCWDCHVRPKEEAVKTSNESSDNKINLPVEPKVENSKSSNESSDTKINPQAEQKVEDSKGGVKE
ncbi:MAG: sulfate reduction electron transfer complex DsrMKJOP subunit DsrJ [Nitrospirae bacterium]|nr:sulfate reduction electron transfer complex DsrMKJOP subunit DsrJ [Nitrospirota bacterium]